MLLCAKKSGKKNSKQKTTTFRDFFKFGWIISSNMVI